MKDVIQLSASVCGYVCMCACMCAKNVDKNYSRGMKPIVTPVHRSKLQALPAVSPYDCSVEATA